VSSFLTAHQHIRGKSSCATFCREVIAESCISHSADGESPSEVIFTRVRFCSSSLTWVVAVDTVLQHFL